MVTPMVTGKKRISVYVDEQTKKDLERLSKIRKRTLSNFIEVSMQEIIEAAKRTGEFEDAD